MLKKLKEHAGIAALVVAVMALFVALTGIAGALPGKNGVNSGDIKNNSIKSGDVKNDALTGDDIKESTLKLPSSAAGGSGKTFATKVAANGAVLASNISGVTVNAQGTGLYTVTYPRSVDGCVTSATDGSTGGVATAIRSSVSTSPQIFVGAANNANTTFNLFVLCPN